jgi:hypothetical protein
MPMRLHLAISAASLLLLPAAASAVAAPAELVYTDQMHLPATCGTPAAVTADAETGAYYAAVCEDANGAYAVYEGNRGGADARKVDSGMFQTSADFAWALFHLTSDGHVLSAVRNTFKVDGADASRAEAYPYNIGLEKERLYDKGTVTFPETDGIIRYDVKARARTTLYKAPAGSSIFYMRVRGKDVYYVTQDLSAVDSYRLYKNGVRYSDINIDNPTNFAVSDSGDVYFFSRQGDSYVLYKNNKEYFRGKGAGGFIYTDPQNNAYHIGFDVQSGGATGQQYHVYLYKNGKKINAMPYANAEGFMAFGEKGAFAIRVAPSSRQPTTLKFLKNGRILGASFPFGDGKDQTDYNGLQFGPQGKTYMRNLSHGRWMLFEDGKPVYDDKFQDVLYFHADPNGVRVYGTRKTAAR